MNQPTDTLQRDATNRPLILISNDDGFEANGIRALVDFVKPLGDVLVCAPEGPRSGFSRAFSATDPLTLRRRDNMGEGVEVWSCSGTPVDCVKLAFDQFCLGKRLPDLVLGGINHGDNSTVNNHYSGTMGVAMEGCMKYIPSIAFSSCYYHPDANLEPLRPYVQEIVGRVLAEGLPKGICLNVNFPARQEFEGVRVCRMTYGRWVDEVMKRPHPRGYDYYWVVGSYQNDEPDARDSDQWALNHGFVAITPTNLDVTAYEYMEHLREWDF
ncbi:MAG: 5'/3'-nucleotidase SurE [Prevotella sp.]|nr:5'/3'-nucleotidase SurE [Prevotella sp.]MBR5918914.1 5'/3'-nucleotidase SurE [Prevotella sp.]MBR6456478.1 5'/3'-nucleotidase SurE [Prevotella sp.]